VIYFLRLWWLRWRLETRLAEVAIARARGASFEHVVDLQTKAQVLVNRIATIRMQHTWMRRV
jgi:hypothetical protein